MRTSADHVYAVGDAVLADNTSAGRAVAVEHWGDAMTMGEIAGRQAAGHAAEWSQSPGFWSTIGGRTLKYSAWGDGFDEAQVVERGDGAFTVWYGKRGQVAGVLTYRSDRDYERGQRLVEQSAPWGTQRDG
jgi:NADPH-dependent 2,4-dienoyl-CoA reductase/sulfur reductase-like enzyme